MLTEAKRKPALGALTTGWVAWPEHKRYYRLIEGELFVIPARPDGTMWVRAADYDDQGGLCGFEINWYGGTPEELADMDEVMLVLALAAGWRPETCPGCGFMWGVSDGHGECFDWTRVDSYAGNFFDADASGDSRAGEPPVS